MIRLDATHDPSLQSWVGDANGHRDFPIQNLPLGVFSTDGGERRVGTAIGDHVLDLEACVTAGLLQPYPFGDTLNALLAEGADTRHALRRSLSHILARGSPAATHAARLLHAAKDCTLHVPAAIGDYTDFYAGIHHALAVGKLFRPDAPLMSNYKFVPIAYHGRASSVRPSGVPVRRPHGQRRPADQAAPEFGPCQNLDFELEFGVWIGPGNTPGAPIPVGAAADHIAGFCLLNDWSARDIQAWECQPLGPFLAKNFATTISPWIVTPEALAPFRVAQPRRPDGDPEPLPHLWDDADQQCGAFDIELEVSVLTPAMRAAGLPPYALSHSNVLHTYWTVAQMVAHHSSNGCDLRPGDLFGSGTLSAPVATGCGSLLELTQGGSVPITLPSAEVRRFLADGDEIMFQARAIKAGAVSIGFGACRAAILPG
jgi:fumarylacetoacetase